MLEQEFQSVLDAQDPLCPWRKKAWERFSAVGWPTEAFQYIPLKGLTMPSPAQKKGEKTGSADAIAFVDGFLDRSCTELCLPLDEAMGTYGVFLQSRMTKTFREENDPLALLNFAFQGKGAFLYIPAKREETVVLEQLFTSEQMCSSRFFIYVGANARLRVMQRTKSPLFANLAIDIVLDQGAELIFNDVPSCDGNGVLFQSVRASLKRDSRFIARFYSEGARLHRTSIRVQLMEENCEALLQGLWRQGDARECHVHTLVEHLAPHTRSRQHFKGVLKERSRSSFEGKIYVHPTAQKTESYQLNNNLLLSDEAVAFSKPNLEVFADDVKASHGATIAQLDVEDLFYLRSRGIEEEAARNCLTEGFCSELKECMPL